MYGQTDPACSPSRSVPAWRAALMADNMTVVVAVAGGGAEEARVFPNTRTGLRRLRRFLGSRGSLPAGRALVVALGDAWVAVYHALGRSGVEVDVVNPYGPQFGTDERPSAKLQHLLECEHAQGALPWDDRFTAKEVEYLLSETADSRPARRFISAGWWAAATGGLLLAAGAGHRGRWVRRHRGAVPYIEPSPRGEAARHESAR